MAKKQMRRIRRHPRSGTGRVTTEQAKEAARKVRTMRQVERVRSVSAVMWLVSATNIDKDNTFWGLSTKKQMAHEGFRYIGASAGAISCWLCHKDIEEVFGAELDPDAPPRRVRVTIELIDE